MSKLLKIMIIILLLSSPFEMSAMKAPKEMKKFNMVCPAQELCPLLDQAFDSCYSTNKAQVCSTFVYIFKKLIPTYDCQRAVDHTPSADYIVPGIYICSHEKQWNYFEMLSKLEIPEAEELFASPEFRSILDGEFGEGFRDLSLNKEKEIKERYKSK